MNEKLCGTASNVLVAEKMKVITRRDAPESQRLIRSILRKEYQEIEVFKDSVQSYVAHIEIKDLPFILKTHRKRNNAKWHRFLSLFKGGESVRRFKSMVRLRELGFDSPEPILAAEKRTWKMVTQDYLLYAFNEGKECNCRDSRLILPKLLHLHKLGYLRRDPYAKNFLTHNGKVFFIDFRLKKPVILRRLRLCVETSKYLRICPDAINYIPHQIRNSFNFMLSNHVEKLCDSLKQKRRSVKRFFRRINPLAMTADSRRRFIPSLKKK